MRISLLLLLFAGLASAQLPLGFGIKGGVPLTGIVKSNSGSGTKYTIDTKYYTLGAMAELRLPFRLAVEGDVLYRRLNYNSTSLVTGILAGTTVTGNAWEFPLVLKYKFKGVPLLHPYIESGIAFRTFSGLDQVIRSTIPGSAAVTTSAKNGDLAEKKDTFNKGLVFGAGLEFHPPLVRISPEIRYTHWTSDPFRSSDGLLRSVRNQAQVLIGISF